MVEELTCKRQYEVFIGWPLMPPSDRANKIVGFNIIHYKATTTFPFNVHTNNCKMLTEINNIQVS